MSARSAKSNCGFLCFGAAAVEEAEAWEMRQSSVGSSGRSDEPSPDGRRPSRRPFHPRAVAKVFRSVAFVVSLNQRGRERKDSNRLVEGKGSDSTVKNYASESSGKSMDRGDDRRAAAVLSSSSSSASSSSFCPSSSSSTSSSHLSSATSSGFPDPSEPKEWRKRAPRRGVESRRRPPPAKAPAQATSRNCGPATAACLILVSLTMMVFCGRLCAILWTSSCFCLVARRNSGGGTTEEAAATAKLRRKEAEAESEEKRRVVFEGLLHRNRKL